MGRTEPTPWTQATVERIELEEHEKNSEARNQTEVFIQWKGTDVCFDFWCAECGAEGHFDGYFAYMIRCGSCGALYAMPFTVYPVRISEPFRPMADPVVVEPEGDSPGTPV